MAGALLIRCGCGQAFRVPLAKAGQLCTCPHCGRGSVAPSGRIAIAGGDASRPESVPLEWREGDVILGLYEVVRVLGRGGMGTVYLVHHRGWNIELAVKTPKSTLLAKAGGAEIFEHECQTWVNLAPHPNTVNCYYVRRLGELPRVFAEYIDGGSLDDWIVQGRCYTGTREEIIARLLDIAIQAAWGLRHAHARGLVHHDVKPANLLLTTDGVVKVTDFGLAHILDVANTKAGQHPSGRFLGTPAYCSPEQARADSPSFPSDIWSYALAVLEMFMGERTWMAGPAARDVLQGYLELGPERLDIPPMPERLVRLLFRSFEESPKARPADFDEILDELRRIYHEAIGTPYPRPEPKPSSASACQLSNRAISLLDLGHTTEAEAVWNSLLANYPQHREGIFNQGMHLWRTGQISDVELMRRITELCRIEPENWAPRLMLAHVHLERGDAAALEACLAPEDCPPALAQERADLLEYSRRRGPTARGRLLTFSAHSDKVSAVFLSWDAHFALTGSESGAVKYWDMSAKECKGAFSSHRGRVNAVSLTADGMHALTAGGDLRARLWNLVSGECVQTFRGHQKAVTGAVTTPDTRFVLTSSMDGLIVLWNFSSGEQVRVLAGHAGGVCALCVGEMGRYVLSGGEDGTMRLWDYSSGDCQETIQAHRGGVSALCIRRDCRFALSGGADGLVHLWELGTSERTRTLRGENGAINGIAMSRDGRFALTSAEGGNLILWELKTGRCLYTFSGQGPLSLSGDGRFALSGAANGGVSLWSVSCGEPPVLAPMALSRSD